MVATHDWLTPAIVSRRRASPLAGAPKDRKLTPSLIGHAPGLG